MGSISGFSLSNYIKILVQQEACDWTGKREAVLRVAGTEQRLKRGKARWSMDRKKILIPSGFKQPQVVKIFTRLE